MSKLRNLLAVPVAALIVTLTGCAAITPQEYTPAPVQLAKQHPQTVSVSVQAKDMGDAERTKTESANMTAALSDAITASKAFSGVLKEGGDYKLTVQVFNQTVPVMGFSMSTTLEMGWTLTRKDTGAVVWQESIKTEHTTGATEAFSGAERVKMAISASVKKNYVEGLKRIAALQL
ncbi:hypothetical protein GJ699_28295 [Duganella sp. FT80W]|uniref:DUF4410 domain-containing protein n=1 Tax=Duganella guangzhouensis TaxID=2666084 RepID=A0A6I2LCB8_9BURK|nr:hypothetical protein [Duganella guangzhouensis]MRW93899.1 hypothetical protein [Duganella guangzhouensis]